MGMKSNRDQQGLVTLAVLNLVVPTGYTRERLVAKMINCGEISEYSSDDFTFVVKKSQTSFMCDAVVGYVNMVVLIVATFRDVQSRHCVRRFHMLHSSKFFASCIAPCMYNTHSCRNGQACRDLRRFTSCTLPKPITHVVVFYIFTWCILCEVNLNHVWNHRCGPFERAFKLQCNILLVVIWQHFCLAVQVSRMF